MGTNAAMGAGASASLDEGGARLARFSRVVTAAARVVLPEPGMPDMAMSRRRDGAVCLCLSMLKLSREGYLGGAMGILRALPTS